MRLDKIKDDLYDNYLLIQQHILEYILCQYVI